MAGLNEIQKDIKTNKEAAFIDNITYTSSRGYTPATDPTRFDGTYPHWNDKPEYQIRPAGAASTDETGKPHRVANIEGFTIYGKGTGTWTVQVSPDPGSNVWVDIASKTGNGYITNSEHHNFVRVNVSSGANVELWIFRKYATF